MGYETGTNGIGVGQTYGVVEVGAGVGQVAGNHGLEKQLIFDMVEGTSGRTYSQTIIEDEYYLTEAFVVPGTDYATGATVNLSVDSGAGVTTAMPLDSTLADLGDGYRNLVTDTTLANQTGQGPVTLSLSLNSLATASATGAAKVVVVMKKGF
jgi:hypothetical protein